MDAESVEGIVGCEDSDAVIPAEIAKSLVADDTSTTVVPSGTVDDVPEPEGDDPTIPGAVLVPGKTRGVLEVEPVDSEAEKGSFC